VKLSSGKSKRLQNPNKLRRQGKLLADEQEMSFNLGLNRVQEVLVVGLMIVLVFAMFSNMEFADKISIGVIVFALIFLTSIANQILNQLKERRQS
jgi:hypothetical protein